MWTLSFRTVVERGGSITSKEALQRVVAIDEEIEVLKKALCPFERGIPVNPDMDAATMEKMVDLMGELKVYRKNAATLVHDLAEKERNDPLRVRNIMIGRKQNAVALKAGLSLLSEYEYLKA